MQISQEIQIVAENVFFFFFRHEHLVEVVEI